jgi:sugar transferase EpsL
MASAQKHLRNCKLKYLFDLSIGSIALVLMSPLVFVIAILVAIFLGKPILFRQQRPGLDGKPFTILKFRTMTDSDCSSGQLRPDSERITTFGRFLRSTSLDELPELINVIRGEMSIVGPRPLLERYLERYSSFQMRRHEVLPGITGWAQINGRNSVDWDHKFMMDVWYVDHQSFWLDLKIILLTFWKILTRDGIDQPGVVGASEFMGYGPVNDLSETEKTLSCGPGVISQAVIKEDHRSTPSQSDERRRRLS